MKITITDSENGRVLREYLRKDIGFSSKQLKKMKFSDDGIKVNGAHVTVRYILKTGDVLELADGDTEDDVNPYIVPGSETVPVVFEDASLTVVNKPAGMPAHPSLGHKTDTVANALALRYIGTPYVFRPVNRLDGDTSGVMITANTRLAAYAMFRELKSGRVKKTYVAVLDGVPDAGDPAVTDDGDGVYRITSYMRRRAESIIERVECASDDDGAKLAVTRFKVIASDGKHSVVAAEPVTGRTHQLRVHFASRGCPITGDTLYGTPSEYIGRQALHAVSTSFCHPDSRETVTVRAPLEGDIVSLIGRLFGDAEAILEEIGKL